MVSEHFPSMHKALASSPAPKVGLMEEEERMRERETETEGADRDTQSNGTHLVCLYT